MGMSLDRIFISSTQLENFGSKLQNVRKFIRMSIVQNLKFVNIWFSNVSVSKIVATIIKLRLESLMYKQ